MQPSLKKTVWFAGVSKANRIKCQQYFWQYYPLFPTCILLWQPAQMCFVFLKVMKAAKCTYLCLACYLHSLNTCTYLMGTLIFLFLEQTAQFSLLKMRSQNSNVPLANRKAASLPPPPPPTKILCPSDQVKAPSWPQVSTQFDPECVWNVLHQATIFLLLEEA